MWRKYSTADKGEKGLLSYVERIHDFVVTATDHFYLGRVEKLPMLFPVLVKTNQKCNSSAYRSAKHGKQAENPSVFSADLENILLRFSRISTPMRRMV